MVRWATIRFGFICVVWEWWNLVPRATNGTGFGIRDKMVRAQGQLHIYICMYVSHLSIIKTLCTLWPKIKLRLCIPNKSNDEKLKESVFYTFGLLPCWKVRTLITSFFLAGKTFFQNFSCKKNKILSKKLTLFFININTNFILKFYSFLFSC